MSVLRTIESKIEGLFEGVFGRAFKTSVQPIELARKLAKEMEENRSVSVSRVYVPNEYSVYLSPEDRQAFSSYESSLLRELEKYLADHARREGFALLTEPIVIFHTDADLELGQFGIATRVVQGPGPLPSDEPPLDAAVTPPVVGPPAAPPQSAPPPAPSPEIATSATMLYSAATSSSEQPPAAAVWLELGATRIPVTGTEVEIGRSQGCAVHVDDPNVSRRHARLVNEEGLWWIVDLDSTNGTGVNGRRVRRARVGDGDRITAGSTELVFRREVS